MMTRRLAVLALICAATPAFAQDKAALAWTLPWDADWVTAVAFVGNSRVVAGNNLGHLVAWDLPESPNDPAPKPARILDGHTNTITQLIPSPDGRLLYSASNDKSIRVWDVLGPSAKKGVVVTNARAIAEADSKKKKPPVPNETAVDVIEAVRTFTGHKDWVVGLSLSRDGQTIASGDEKGEVIVWDAGAGTEKKRWKLKGWVYGLALSPEADMLAVSERIPLVFDSGRHSALKLWSAQGEMKVDLPKLVEKGVMISCIRYSPDGKAIAIGKGGETDTGKITLLEADTGKVRKDLTPGHLYGLTDIAFSGDGKILATCGRDTVARLWDPESGKLLKELGQPRGGQFKDWFHSVAFSPDNRYLAAADMAGQVHIYSLAGKEK